MSQREEVAQEILENKQAVEAQDESSISSARLREVEGQRAGAHTEEGGHSQTIAKDTIRVSIGNVSAMVMLHTVIVQRIIETL